MRTVRPSPLLEAMERVGGVVAEYHGRALVRHFGDAAAEYEAATERLAIFDRSHRARLVVRGRAPGQMLNGVLTGTIPTGPTETDDGVWAGRATYHCVLTPKGKMITDLWAGLLGDEESAGFLLDVPVAGHGPLLESFAKLLPPRFASVEDASERTAMVTLVGPKAAQAVSASVLDARLDAAELEELQEGEWRSLGSPAEALVAIRTEEVWPPAWSVVGPSEAVQDLWGALVENGARPAGLGVWSTLRVEAGRPLFGTDMDADTIPIEAGIDERAIDHTKGCYTGQEVIVRIRDRGHVNRHIHLLELGDVPTPSSGTELVSTDGSDRPVGRITSAVESPKHGGVLALAYVRRDVDAVSLDGREISVPG